MMQGLLRRGWPRALLAASWVVTAFFAATFALADVAIPPLKARVTDLTATLTSQQQAMLEQTLAALEKRKGSQLAVLIVPTTQPETVEQYAVRVEENWKLGRKGVDDGVLLVVAKNDRKLRIEVGYGLEGVLPDATAKRIIEEEIVPRFKQGDFNGGISAGVERIIKVIDGETLPPPKVRSQRGDRFSFDDFQALLGFGFLLVFVFGAFLRAMFGRFIGAGIVGGLAGGLAWLISGAFLLGIIAAVLAFIFTLMSGGFDKWGGSGSGSSSGSGGSYSSGSDFGGGGGSSGGGGASGSW